MTGPAVAAITPGSGKSTKDDVRSQYIYLAMATAVLILAATLQTQGRSEVRVPGLGAPLPETCGMRRLVGIDCPGCGLTRSFIRLAHADLAGALAFHPVGPLVFAFVAAQVPFRGWQIWRSHTGRRLWRPGWWIHLPLAVIITLLIARWVIRLVTGEFSV